MFDLYKRKYIWHPTVKDMISVLEEQNPEALVAMEGLNEFYIHIFDDDSLVALDTSALSDDYESLFEEKKEPFPKTYERKSCLDPYDYKDIMSRKECMDLLYNVVDNVSEQFLLSHGFTKEQIDRIKGEYDGRREE